MADFASISNLDQSLVRKALTGSLFVAPYTAQAVTASTLFGVDGSLAALPTGYTDGGITTDDGLRFARAQETEDITGWQILEPVRTDRTSDTETIAVDFIQTSRLTIELFTGADLSSATLTNGALTIQKPALPTDRYYRLLAVAVDNVQGEEFYAIRFYPRCKITTWSDQAFAKAGALTWGVTFTAYVDPTLEYSKDEIYGGPGLALLATAMGIDTTP